MTEAPKTPPPPPPSSGAAAPSGTASPASPGQVGGLERNVAAALAYFVIVGIIWLVLEPYNKDRFLRFHAIQAIGLAVVATGLSIALGMIPILGWILLMFLPFVMFVVWIICAVKAFQSQWFKLPVIGDFAEKNAGPA